MNLPLFLFSEGRTVVKCIREYNQSVHRVVFDTEPVAMSTTFCALLFLLQCKHDFIV